MEDSQPQYFVVDYIVQARVQVAKCKKIWEFEVKWDGYADNKKNNTWQHEDDFSGDLVDQFWKKADTGGRDKDDMKQWKIGENVLASDLAQRRKKKGPAKTRQSSRRGRARKAEEENIPPPARPSSPHASDLEHVQTRKVPRNVQLVPLDNLPASKPLRSRGPATKIVDPISSDSEFSMDEDEFSIKGVRGQKAAKALARSTLEGTAGAATVKKRKVTAAEVSANNPPLHVAIAFNLNASEIEPLIRTAYASDPACIDLRDNGGFVPMHLAAFVGNLTAVRTLLELGIDRETLRDRNNADRHAPLMSLQHRSRMHAHLSLAEKEQIQTLMKEALNDYPQSSCTCNMCEDGWMSPKMRDRLRATACDIGSNMGKRTYPFAAPPRRPLNELQVAEDPYAKYLAESTQKNIFVMTYKGYQGVIFITERILARDSTYQISLTNLSEKIRTMVSQDLSTGQFARFGYEKFFFKHHGRVDCVLDCLIDFAEKRGADEKTPWPEFSASLPSCLNDSNFDLVRRKFGLWGEY